VGASGVVGASVVAATAVVTVLTLVAAASDAGVGAYGAGMTVASLHGGYLLGMIVGVLLAMVLGVLVGLPALRLHGITLAIVTLGIALGFDKYVFQDHLFATRRLDKLDGIVQDGQVGEAQEVELDEAQFFEMLLFVLSDAPLARIFGVAQLQGHGIHPETRTHVFKKSPYFRPNESLHGEVAVPSFWPTVTGPSASSFMSGEEWCELHFSECRIPAENVLLGPGGFQKQMAGFNVERLGNTARSLAYGRYAFNAARAPWIEENCRSGALGCVACKGELAETMNASLAPIRARLRIPREHMRGFNQLLVHVHYPEQDPCAPAVARGAPGELCCGAPGACSGFCEGSGSGSTAASAAQKPRCRRSSSAGRQATSPACSRGAAQVSHDLQSALPL